MGTGSKAGFMRIFNYWLIFHLMIGVFLSALVPLSLEDASLSLLLPLSGIFIGLTFAWGGNAQALIQTEEIRKFSEYRKGGILEYIYSFQLSILLILFSLSLWAIAGLGIFDKVWPTVESKCQLFVVSSILYAIASLTIRECWHVVLAVQYLVITKLKIMDELNKK